jgi:tetratricopeptide (TPR) repeat protein
MLSTLTKNDKKVDVFVAPERIQICINSFNGNSLVFDLPSPLELSDLKVDKTSQISLSEIANKSDPFNIESNIKFEISNLLKKETKFGKSATYQSHLANLYEIANEKKLELRRREVAVNLSDNSVYRHKLAKTSFEENEISEAIKILSVCNDVYSLLKIASIYAVENKIKQSTELVDEALIIDALSYKARMFKGALCLYERQPQDAIRHFKIALDSHPYSSALFVNLGIAYCQMKQFDKAIKSLRKALILDPLNKNALIFFADLSFEQGNILESIDWMETYTNYERKSGSIWGRLARANVFLEDKNKKMQNLQLALDALKNELAIERKTSTLNNIGVIYNEIGDKDKALRFFNLSYLSSESIEESQSAISNLANIHLNNGDIEIAYNLLAKHLQIVVGKEQEQTYSHQKLYSILVRCISQLPNKSEHISLLESLLKTVEFEDIKIDMYTFLIYYHTIERPIKQKIIEYSEYFLKEDKKSISENKINYVGALNNLIFALYLFDEVEFADGLLDKIISFVRSSPYVTATFGMSLLKKGNIKRGIEYYKEAISTLTSPDAKSKFKQIMNYEVGKAYLNSNQISKANRYLRNAKEENKGFVHIKKQATSLLTQIKHSSF